MLVAAVTAQIGQILGCRAMEDIKHQDAYSHNMYIIHLATASQYNRLISGVTWLRLYIPDEQRCSEFAEAIDERLCCSSQTVHCNSPHVT